MRVVIDAQLVNYFFRESVLEETVPDVTCPVEPFFRRLGRFDVGLLDDDLKIESEWRSAVSEKEWFEEWFATELALGHLAVVVAGTHRECIKRLRVDHGFARGRDTAYVRTALSARQLYDEAIALLTEDMDFHEPRKKGCAKKTRRKILCSGSGRMAVSLRKKGGVEVASVQRFMDVAAAA